VILVIVTQILKLFLSKRERRFILCDYLNSFYHSDFVFLKLFELLTIFIIAEFVFENCVHRSDVFSIIELSQILSKIKFLLFWNIKKKLFRDFGYSLNIDFIFLREISYS